jgi:hypothetical protein
MSGELRESSGPKSRETSSQGSRSVPLKGNGELWRETMRWLTPNHIEALGDFMWNCAISICVLATVFLEAKALEMMISCLSVLALQWLHN